LFTTIKASVLLKKRERDKEMLKEQIRQSSEDLNRKNKKLEDYSFHNAHKIRAGVSTILGFRELLRISTTPHEKALVIEKLLECVAELDIEVEQTQQILDR
jgi:light-regulated signal transduction histidine kinase (bacteriophytochrome)